MYAYMHTSYAYMYIVYAYMRIQYKILIQSITCYYIPLFTTTYYELDGTRAWQNTCFQKINGFENGLFIIYLFIVLVPKSIIHTPPPIKGLATDKQHDR